MRLLAAALALWAALAVGSLAAAPPEDDPVSVTVTVAPTTIRTGDQVVLRVAVTHPQGARIQFPEASTIQSGPLEVLRVQPGQGARALSGEVTTAVEYTLGVYAPGTYRVPGLEVGYTLPDGTGGRVTASPGIEITVESVLAGLPNASLQDIRPPVALPEPPTLQPRPLAAVALAVALALLAVLLLRRVIRHRRPAPLAPAPALSAEEQVRGALRGAAARLAGEPPDYLAFYTGVSAAVREYLETRTGLPALTSTTRELRRTMEVRRIDRWHARIILGLLDECDAVKWAHYSPDAARAQRALTMAYEIVDLVEAAATPVGPPPTLSPAGVRP